jgi:hypothetical protein
VSSRIVSPVSMQGRLMTMLFADLEGSIELLGSRYPVLFSPSRHPRV